MKAVKYIPTVAKGESKQFEGHIMLRPPTFDERWSYLEESQLKFNEEGEADIGINQLGALRRLVRFSEKHYEEVKLKNLDTKTTYKTFEDLVSDPMCDKILFEVAGVMTKGISPSPNSRP